MEIPSENYKNFSKSDKIFSKGLEEFLSFKNRLWKSFDFFWQNIHPCIFLFKIYPLIPSSQRLSFFLYTPFINFCEDKKRNKKKELYLLAPTLIWHITTLLLINNTIGTIK